MTEYPCRQNQIVDDYGICVWCSEPPSSCKWNKIKETVEASLECFHIWKEHKNIRICLHCGLLQHSKIVPIQLHSSDFIHLWELWYDGVG
jgi:hypothetical protein